VAPHLLVLAVATPRDDHDLLRFQCWSGDPDEHWVQEVEEYVQKLARKRAFKTLLFRGADGELDGITVFDRSDVPLAGRRKVPGWHLQAVALSRRLQREEVQCDIEGCDPIMRASEYLFRKTYERMLALDPRRVITTARVHDENTISMVAAARVGLRRVGRDEYDDRYWDMSGEVDPCVGPV
jgi:hypothetical protein